MTITVRKDPARRLGGWALVEFEGTAEATGLVVERDDGALFLGPHGWQGAPHTFDPYPVEQGRDGSFIRVGPEVVNHLEPYLIVTLKLPAAGAEQMLSWPDDVIPAPDAFEGGGVQGNARLVPETPHLREGHARAAPAAADPAPPPDPAPAPADLLDADPPAAAPAPPPRPEPFVEPDRDVPKTVIGGAPPPRPRTAIWPYLVAFALILVAGAGAGYYYWDDLNALVDPGEETRMVEPTPATGDDPATPPAAQDPVQPEQPTRTADRAPPACTRDDALGEGDPDRFRRIVALCREAGDVAVEIDALDRLDRTADVNLRWAQLYDPRRTEDGVPFPPDASSAARYYRAAAADGAPEAEAALAGLCAWLAEQSDASLRAQYGRICQ